MAFKPRGFKQQRDMAMSEMGQSSSTKRTRPKESQLASKLLQFWASGRMSAIEVQVIAYAAQLDGAEREELELLVSAGNYGVQPGNCHTDIVT